MMPCFDSAPSAAALTMATTCASAWSSLLKTETTFQTPLSPQPLHSV